MYHASDSFNPLAYHFRAADASINGAIWQVRWHGFSFSNGRDMPFTGAGDRN